jgi:hypothetical protein
VRLSFAWIAGSGLGEGREKGSGRDGSSRDVRKLSGQQKAGDKTRLLEQQRSVCAKEQQIGGRRGKGEGGGGRRPTNGGSYGRVQSEGFKAPIGRRGAVQAAARGQQHKDNS